jgi:hypothetical protein
MAHLLPADCLFIKFKSTWCSLTTNSAGCAISDKGRAGQVYCFHAQRRPLLRTTPARVITSLIFASKYRVICFCFSLQRQDPNQFTIFFVQEQENMTPHKKAHVFFFIWALFSPSMVAWLQATRTTTCRKFSSMQPKLCVQECILKILFY